MKDTLASYGIFKTAQPIYFQKLPDMGLNRFFRDYFDYAESQYISFFVKTMSLVFWYGNLKYLKDKHVNYEAIIV